jgi:hypothetical protein
MPRYFKSYAFVYLDWQQNAEVAQSGTAQPWNDSLFLERKGLHPKRTILLGELIGCFLTDMWVQIPLSALGKAL